MDERIHRDMTRHGEGPATALHGAALVPVIFLPLISMIIFIMVNPEASSYWCLAGNEGMIHNNYQ